MKKKLYLTIALLALPSVCGAASYYLDYDLGDDANTGLTEGAAWKNIAKLGTATFAAGDIIKLANNRTWDMWGLAAVRIMNNTMRGTAANHITITNYTPTGETFEHKPTISRYYDTLSTDWTWDASQSAWYIAGDSAAFGIPYGTAVFFGFTQETKGVWMKHFVSPYTEFSSARQFAVDTVNRRLYVWTPSDADNPVTYYQGVRVLSGQMINFEAYTTKFPGEYTDWENLRFENGGRCFYLLTDSGSTGGVQHITFDGIEVDNAASVMLTAAGNATYKTNDITLQNSRFEHISGAGLHTMQYSTDIKSVNNYYDGCSEQASFGGCIYWQTDFNSSTFDEFHHAYFGSNPDSYVDGAAVYFEGGGGWNVVDRARVYESTYAFQNNSGSPGNVIKHSYTDTGAFIIISDADNREDMGLTLINNTAECDWLDRETAYGNIRDGCIHFNQSVVGTFTAQNNSFNGTVSGVAGHDVILSVPPVPPTMVFETNALHGYRKTASYAADDADYEISATNLLIDPVLDTQGRPTAKTPAAIKRGGLLIDGYPSIAGKWNYIGARPWLDGNPGIPGKPMTKISGGAGLLGGGTVYNAPAEEYLGNYFLDGSTVFLDGSTYFVDGGL